MTRIPPQRNERRLALGVTGLATLLALALALPLLTAPGERLFGVELVGRHHDAYNYVSMFERQPVLRYYTQPVTDWTGSVLGMAFGGVMAYNLLVLLSFPLTALTTFLLARYLGASPIPSGFAALLFAFGPFHVAHGAYHPHISQLQWLPLVLLFMFRLLDRPGSRTALAFAAALAVLIGASFYNVLVAVVIVPVGTLGFWLAARSEEADDGGSPAYSPARGVAITLAITGGLAVIAVAALLLIQPLVLTSWGRLAFRASELELYSARPWSYFVPPPDHPLLGAWATAFWDGHPLRQALVEHQLYVGFAVLLLAALALGRSGPGESRHRLALVAIAVGAFIASLPPTWTIGPWTLRGPSWLLYQMTPMFRAYARLGIVAVLVALLLASLALTRVLRGSRRSRAIGSVLMIVAVLELTPWPPARWHDVLPTQAHRWLASQGGPMQILDCARPTFGDQSVTPLMPHPTSILGVFSHVPPEADRQRFWSDDAVTADERPVSDCAEPGLPAKLAAMGYTHVLVRDDYRLAEGVAADGLAELRRFPDSVVFTVEASPAPIYTERIGGFSWRSRAQAPSWRWMGPFGRWAVYNTSKRGMTAELDIELVSYHRPRTVRVLLNDQAIAEITIDIEPNRFVLGPMPLAPGRNVLHFVPAGRPTAPIDVGDSSDQRPLTIGTGMWIWTPLAD